MASREEILKAVRAHQPAAPELPELEGQGVRYEDRRGQLAALLEAVGGRCHFVKDVSGVNAVLADLKEYATARKTVSLVPGAGRSTLELDAVEDPHELEDMDFAIVSGQLAVAENGAVWVTDENVKHRAIFFIVQYLALVVRADTIVDNMHQAYERLAFEDTGFGCFISGPSKTADIEQSLVIGAHGPRSLTLFCLTAAEHP
jgi:L-lactate dehydrogenase complex protein LldG